MIKTRNQIIFFFAGITTCLALYSFSAIASDDPKIPPKVWEETITQELKTKGIYDECMNLNKEFKQAIFDIREVKYERVKPNNEWLALVIAYSCMSGTAGPDIGGVYAKIGNEPISKPILLTFPEKTSEARAQIDLITKDNGIEYFRTHRGAFTFGDGYLVQSSFGVRKNDPNCCPSGGELKSYYSFEKGKLKFEKIEYTKQ